MSINIAVLASGRGSNLEAILEAIAQGKLDAKVKLVLVNVPGAGAIEIASKYGVATAVVPNAGLNRKEHEEKVIAELKKHDLDFIVLAGYMRVLSSGFLANFKDERGFFKVINIHPSLLPAFPGIRGYEEAFEYGVKVAGVTVHLVDEKVDHGPILAQATFNRAEDDTIESFKARGLRIEHELYPQVLQNIAKDGVTFFKRIKDETAEAQLNQGTDRETARR
ncbi:MAG TPA: phosphoribosylglycinamide formyltransferase [Candidatus Melainabacteria bacterium]|jgi:phosphoribosylglycinamide formyltransferase 1|nr:phosphoribosylglycinamide formyltransferase [Candidatus Melainabacteria bacterium]HIN63403.1 phosphoribosylglycinamide formyltransferase [Candidatus Obscuribacterales bacterium]